MNVRVRKHQRPTIHAPAPCCCPAYGAEQVRPISQQRATPTWETRKGIVAGREVEHLHHLREFAITKLCNTPPRDIPKYELAEMDLICAYGLTSKHDIEIEPMLKTLDSWTEQNCGSHRQADGPFPQEPLKFRSLGKFSNHSDDSRLDQRVQRPLQPRPHQRPPCLDRP